MKKCTSCKVYKEYKQYNICKNRPRGKSWCKKCERLNRRKVARACKDCGNGPRWSRCLKCRKLFSNRQSLRQRGKGVGPANSNWKEGATRVAQLFYTSSEWKELRTKVFVRDNYTCQDCNQRGGKLEANHIKPRSRFPDLKLVESNIETLCKSCHDKKKWMVYIK